MKNGSEVEQIPDDVYQLAKGIDTFMFDFAPYDYDGWDSESRAKNILEIANDIINDKSEFSKEFLCEIINDDEFHELHDEAKELVHRLNTVELNVN